MNNIRRIDEKTVEIDGQIYKVAKPCEVIKKKDNRFKPELGEDYYYISDTVSVCYAPWKNYSTDKKSYSIGNCFRTKEEAEFAMEKLKVLAELSEFTERKDAVYDGENYHWYMYYDISARKLQKGKAHHKYDCALFESESDIENAIEAIGKDRIKKYLFGVEVTK